MTVLSVNETAARHPPDKLSLRLFSCFFFPHKHFMGVTGTMSPAQIARERMCLLPPVAASVTESRPRAGITVSVMGMRTSGAECTCRMIGIIVTSLSLWLQHP